MQRLGLFLKLPKNLQTTAESIVQTLDKANTSLQSINNANQRLVAHFHVIHCIDHGGC